VIGMQTEVTAAVAIDELFHPAYWLVIGLEWQDGEATAETAVAFAPGTIPRDTVSHDVGQVLGCADLYARKRAERVIFCADLTRMFTNAGTSWSQLGVDWENALHELRNGPFPAMFLTISERAHVLICNPTSHPLLITPTGAEDATHERELVRQAIAHRLATDWPPYMQSLVNARRVRAAGQCAPS
jgi:hypothetical protein